MRSKSREKKKKLGGTKLADFNNGKKKRERKREPETLRKVRRSSEKPFLSRMTVEKGGQSVDAGN